MMGSSSGEGAADERLLVRYLLGELPAEEAERFDEMSVADDEVAGRLRAAENDLVDAYVRGELSGPTLERFRSVYMASPRRRGKVEFARALVAYEQRGAAAAVPPPGREPEASGRELRPAGRGGGPAAWFLPQWALAAAAVVAVAGAAYVSIENRRLREELFQTQAARVDAERTAQRFQSELEQERSTSSAVRDELNRLRDSLPSVRVPALRPFLLLPIRRGASEIATIRLPAGVEQVPCRLRLESDDFTSYEAALRDPATGQQLWRSGPLRARPDGQDRSVELQVPAALLKPQNYTLELSGRTDGGEAAFVTSYAFHVVFE